MVVIGAGLTGTAAAYRLKDTRLSVVLLDQGDPAGEASGRNGGNFELLPENSVGIYEGLAPGRFTFMHRRYPKVPVEVLQALSERQASLVLGLALRNRDLLKDTILREGISGRFIPGDGTYHPFKYVCGQLRSALR
ncbi:MAG TPA: FAD-dependent oxidoreductase [Xanthobacteraceae bacterium]|nr:FAD-dependent oxidoreductase [Xanthobacteraceae bacterium]